MGEDIRLWGGVSLPEWGVSLTGIGMRHQMISGYTGSATVPIATHFAQRTKLVSCNFLWFVSL